MAAPKSKSDSVLTMSGLQAQEEPRAGGQGRRVVTEGSFTAVICRCGQRAAEQGPCGGLSLRHHWPGPSPPA